jgi:hypothetical protein
MRVPLICLLVILYLSSLGQQKIWSGDTTYWYNYQKHENKKIGLEELSKCQFPFALRITSLNTVTNIWTEDGKKFNGSEIFFTSTFEDNPENSRYFYKKEIIGEDTAQQIKQLFEKYKIFEIPSQDSIQGWGNGLDGTIYLIEYSTPKSYSFKSYWTPTNFPSIPEAVSISNFVKNIEDLLMQNQKLEDFIMSLPKDRSYRQGNAWTKIKSNSKSK